MGPLSARQVTVVGLAFLFVLTLSQSGWTLPGTVRGRDQLEPVRKWLHGATVVIDPGHGGWDPGAVVGETREKDVVLEISMRLKEVLETQGVTVVMTRETDRDFGGRSIRADLAARMEIVEEHKPRAFVSIHANKDGCNCWGAQTFYQRRGSAAGKSLALALQNQLRKLTPTTRGALPADYFVLRTSPVPAAIVEVGFLTNAKEHAKLKDPAYQRILATAVALGLADFFRSEVPPAKATGSIGQ